MFSINKVTLMGKVVSTPTITQGEKSDISRTRVKTTNGGNVNVIPVIAFGTNAKNLYDKGEYGDDIYLEGRIEIRERRISDDKTIREQTIVIDDFRVFQRPPVNPEPNLITYLEDNDEDLD